jgi:hypothetical protein
MGRTEIQVVIHLHHLVRLLKAPLVMPLPHPVVETMVVQMAMMPQPIVGTAVVRVVVMLQPVVRVAVIPQPVMETAEVVVRMVVKITSNLIGWC